MKVLKESLLMNDLSCLLDVVEETTLIMRNDKQNMVVMTLEEFNKMKEEMYKNKEKR